MLDLVDLDAPAVVAQERGSVLVGQLGAARQRSTAERAVARNVLLGERAVVGIGQVAVEQEREVRVGRIPVEPDCAVMARVVGQHAS